MGLAFAINHLQDVQSARWEAAAAPVGLLDDEILRIGRENPAVAALWARGSAAGDEERQALFGKESARAGRADIECEAVNASQRTRGVKPIPGFMERAGSWYAETLGRVGGVTGAPGYVPQEEPSEAMARGQLYWTLEGGKVAGDMDAEFKKQTVERASDRADSTPARGNEHGTSAARLVTAAHVRRLV